MADASATGRVVDTIRNADDGQLVTETDVNAGTTQPDAKSDEYISEEDALRIRKKIDWHIMPLMCCEHCLSSQNKSFLTCFSVMSVSS